MMAEISKTFIQQGAAVISIAICSILGFNYLANRNDEAIKLALMPIVEKVEKIERLQADQITLLSTTSNRTNIATMCLNNFLSYYNKVNHKEFLKPNEISLTEEKH